MSSCTQRFRKCAPYSCRLVAVAEWGLCHWLRRLFAGRHTRIEPCAPDHLAATEGCCASGGIGVCTIACIQRQARLSRCLGWLPRQVLQQGPGVPEVCRVQPLRAPAVDWPQQVPGSVRLSLAPPQLPQAQRRAQLVGFGLLLPGDRQGLEQTRFRVSLLGPGVRLQQQIPLNAVEFCCKG